MSVSHLIKQVAQKISIVVRNDENVVLLSKQIQEEDICPVFLVSNTSGKGLELFLSFLNLLPINPAN